MKWIFQRWKIHPSKIFEIFDICKVTWIIGSEWFWINCPALSWAVFWWWSERMLCLPLQTVIRFSSFPSHSYLNTLFEQNSPIPYIMTVIGNRCLNVYLYQRFCCKSCYRSKSVNPCTHTDLFFKFLPRLRKFAELLELDLSTYSSVVSGESTIGAFGKSISVCSYPTSNTFSCNSSFQSDRWKTGRPFQAVSALVYTHAHFL